MAIMKKVSGMLSKKEGARPTVQWFHDQNTRIIDSQPAKQAACQALYSPSPCCTTHFYDGQARLRKHNSRSAVIPPPSRIPALILRQAIKQEPAHPQCYRLARSQSVPLALPS